MSWRRTSVDSDGSLNGEPRFAFPQSLVPGAEASLTVTLRNSHEPPRVVPRYSLGYPFCTTTLWFIFTTLSETSWSFWYLSPFSHESTRPTTPLIRHPSVSATCLFRIAGPSLHFIASTSSPFLAYPLYTFVRFDTLRFLPHAANLIPLSITPFILHLSCP